jgi:hypothetical protein
MKSTSPFARYFESNPLKRRQGAQERAARLVQQADLQPREAGPVDVVDPPRITADFDRSCAEWIGPGCYRVLATPVQ